LWLSAKAQGVGHALTVQVPADVHHRLQDAIHAAAAGSAQRAVCTHQRRKPFNKTVGIEAGQRAAASDAEAGAADRDADDGGARHAIGAQPPRRLSAAQSMLALSGIAMLSAP
jgi:hypothetical protein